MTGTARIDWSAVLEHVVEITESYSFAPTLRQVHYRLVAAELIPNTHGAYKRLSKVTAEARREGRCPAFADGTRSIERVAAWGDPGDILAEAVGTYRVDRTEGQAEQLVVVLEKATLSVLARQAVDLFGVPVVALRGYGSQTIIDDVSQLLADDARPARLFYVGDFDPTGLDIERDLSSRLNYPIEIERLAVTREQVVDLGLVAAPAKVGDSRRAAMLAAEGVAVQVEAEAIDPDVLQRMIGRAVAGRLDVDQLERVVTREQAEAARLAEFVDRWAS